MTPVTDPVLLAQLSGTTNANPTVSASAPSGTAVGMMPVTDPATLAQLNSGDQPQTSQSLGFEQGVGNFLANAAQPAIWAGKKLGFDMGDFQQGQDLLRNPANPQNAKPGAIGSTLGSLPPYVASLLLGGGTIGSGLVGGALNSRSDTPLGVAEDAGMSAAAGKAADLGLGAVGKVISPALSPAVQKLLALKIPLTTGQILGGTAKDIEDKLSSMPLVGSMVKNAQSNAVGGFNKAALNSALAPIGKALPAGMDAGREAVDHVASTISDQYDAILPKMSGALDPQFQSEINNIGQSALGTGARQDTLDRFSNIVKSQIAGRADQSGALTGDALKAAQQNLGKINRNLATSQDADDQQLGDMVSDAHDAFNDMLERNNPGYAQDLSKVNSAYAQYVRIRRAASSVGSKDGVFSAPQYASAVRASDNSAGKGAYARGNAFMQDLSDPANQVLPSSVPNSGTADRGLMALLLAGELSPKLAIPGLVGAGMYTQTGQNIARGLVGGSRPAWAPAVGSTVNASRLPLGIFAAQLPSLASAQN